MYTLVYFIRQDDEDIVYVIISIEKNGTYFFIKCEVNRNMMSTRSKY